MKNFKFEDRNFLMFIKKAETFIVTSRKKHKDQITYQFNYFLYNSITNLYLNSGKQIYFVNFSQISNVSLWIILQIFFSRY